VATKEAMERIEGIAGEFGRILLMLMMEVSLERKMRSSGSYISYMNEQH